MSTAIDIKGLNVYFGDSHNLFHAVKSVAFTVESGASFGLVGESGSGKSTILKAITGLAPYWEGEMTVAGQPLGAKRDRAFYKTVQMVFQDPYASLHPRQSVDQVLSETLRLHGFKDINDQVDQLLKDVGLGPAFRFRYPHQLS
ncbi:MAG: ATP-binding cassette domain-containing protein, partial [Pseudomonadota bacterium]|nr:ATP-binding cassette domain-containing protein [Pseudomonadota bacterium]